MKKNKKKDINENKIDKDDLNRIDSSLNSNIENEGNMNDLESRLDDIKKLASDFSMDEETPDEENSDTESESIDNEEDYLDRLSDIQIEKPFLSDVDSEIDLDTRLNQITIDQEKKIIPSIKEEINKPTPAPFIPSPAFKDLDELRTQVNNKKAPISIEDIEQDAEEIMEQSQSNEVFLERVKSSLDEDTEKQEEPSTSKTTIVFSSFDHELDDSELIQELEQEIVNADKASNPFIEGEVSIESDDFLSSLDKITIPEVELNQIENELGQLEELVESELMLSSSSWKDLLESTDDNNQIEGEKAFDFNQEQSFDEFLQEIDSSESEEKTKYSLLGDSLDEEGISTAESTDLESDSSSENDTGTEQEDESVDSLRKSFIDEFDQTAFDEELQKRNKKNWLPRNIEAFSKWFKSLSFAEKILIGLSFVISLAVIVSIMLVVTQWSNNNRKIASPPPAIEATDQDLIYPTGLQLPGGWFFFLQRGEIQNNKWEPQNAEWLANTKLRRVIAIPWSNQSEAVVQSLTTQDEISIYMNNNDIIVYQVEDVLQISRENVRILSDTEPSLVVILFREDNEDRWTIIAKPKPGEK
ncbi:MAG: hypothetical protein CVU41_06015 [Chloroflexi bacterium HGW-Chloroflexi-3]|nr:MAG: hypothetical protein CVU41_06015 [Chloroflexi bacterium HGW-Chloroflexi-3]